MLGHIVNAYWQVCRFIRSPADTPDSSLLTALLIFFYLGISSTMILVVGQAGAMNAMQVLPIFINLMTILAYTYVLIQIYHLRARYVRTVNCLLATMTILFLFSLPLSMMLPLSFDTTQTAEPIQVSVSQLLASLTLLAISIWKIMIYVYIYQQAFSVTRGRAFLMWLGLVGVQMLLFLMGTSI